jgi:hypothetical protein
MRVFWLWHGGSSYAAPDGDDVEEFPSLAAAADEFRRRTQEVFYPVVDRLPPEAGGPTALVYFEPPSTHDYPARLMTFGPKGGLRVGRV